MEYCPECKDGVMKEVKAMGGIRRLICDECGFQMNLDKKKEN